MPLKLFFWGDFFGNIIFISIHLFMIKVKNYIVHWEDFLIWRFAMPNINIANYLIHELEDKSPQPNNQEEHNNIIDNLIDKWSRKEYLNPDAKDNNDT